MYGRRNLHHVYEACLHMFLDKYKPKKTEGSISNVKRMDSSFLPPCSHTLKEKIQRTNFVIGKWSSSTLVSPPDVNPENSGWHLDDENCFELTWFVGNGTPKFVDITHVADDRDDMESDIEEESDSDDSSCYSDDDN